MSTPTLRRIKDRGGGGTKIAAPVSAGEENPNPSLKPTSQQIPRFSRSNSVAPKGRASSPFEPTRILSDMRNNNGFVSFKDSGARPERSVSSSGRRSVDRCRPKIGSFRDSSEKFGERDGKADLGLKENSVVLRGFGVKTGERGRKNGVFDRCQSKVGSFRDLNENNVKVDLGLKENNVVLRDLGVKNGERVGKNEGFFDRLQSKVGTFKDLNGKFGDRNGKVDLGLKDDNAVLRNLGVKSGERVGKSGGIGRKTEGFFGTSQQRNGILGKDSNVKLGERVEKIDGSVKERRGLGRSEVALEKNVEVFKKSEQKSGSLEDPNVRLGETVEKRSGNFEKSEQIFKKDLGVRKSDDLLVRGLKERKSMSSGEGSKVSVIDEGKSDDGLSSNLLKSRPGSSDSDIKRRNTRNVASCEHEKSVNYTRDSAGKVSNALRGSERLKQKGLVEESVSGRSVNKYPSKLHEKLAFLEGKVKRIASDIKRTKEMLDMNNPDSSKVILSDIQEKISGIEKAMGNVGDSDKQINDLEKTENKEKVTETEALEKEERKEVENKNSSVKGLNNEELEARLFPHHKLLRDRTLSKVSSSSSEKLDIEMKADESLDIEMKVEVEFLASLGKDRKKVTVRGENVGSEFCAVQETDGSAVSNSQDSMNVVGKEESIILTTDETLDDIGEQRIKAEIIIEEEIEDSFMHQFSEIGRKTSTGGWFVADGEAALLAHDDGSCSYYDVANLEVKSEYKPPVGIPQNMWRDCWIVRAAGADGSSGRYVVAASAGNTLESGFCSWDFYVKDIRAFHMENATTNSTRTALAPLPNNPSYRRNSFSNIIASENRQWWYRPCGPLIASTASNLKGVSIYDIRDGEQIMKWEVQKLVLSMDYSSPLQWRNRGKIVIAESESVSLWDVSTLTPQALQSISTSGRRVYALHVNNTDAELGGGVRQRELFNDEGSMGKVDIDVLRRSTTVSSSEAEGHDGVFCTADSINVLDFRHPSGIGFKISKIGVNAQSIFSRGDSIFLGCNNAKAAGKNQPFPQIQHFSLRKQKLVGTYSFPESNAHPHYTAITQVWGNVDLVMGVCGLGLCVFDALKDDGVRSFSTEYCSVQKVRETIGPDDLYSPSFDYLSSRVLLISRDRPALWRYLS